MSDRTAVAAELTSRRKALLEEAGLLEAASAELISAENAELRETVPA